MDDKWFKNRLKELGITAEEIAARMGRSRSAVSHIMTGKQRMSLDWAQAFADTLQVPLNEVLHHAGVLDEPETQTLAPGFAESDAVPFQANRAALADADEKGKIFGAGRPGVDVWQVRSMSLSLGGYLPGDFIVVDTHQSEMAKAGDVVIAQRYDVKRGFATTLLRRFEPPVLVAASADPDDLRVYVVDNDVVAIRGRVIASWRE